MSRYSALVRRRRDGRIALDLDLVHAGVVVEALEQTRQVLLGSDPDGSDPDGRDPDGRDGERTASDGESAGTGGRPAAATDDFDSIVAGLGDLGDSVETEEDDDPVLRRLLPDAFLDDATASAEFRRYTADSVLGRKVTAIDSALSDLSVLQRQDGGVVLDHTRAQAWLTALNDARLALGTRLALAEDDDLQAELDAYERRMLEDPEAAEEAEEALRAYRIAVYDFLSGLLDMVVRALDH